MGSMAVKPSAGPVMPGSEEFAEAHRRLVADTSIQFDLNRFSPPHVPSWLKWLGDAFQHAQPAVKMLFWVALALLAVFIVYALARKLGGHDWPWRRRATGEEQAFEYDDDVPARQLLAEADRLADQGLFSQAVHLVLFRTIEDIEMRRPKLLGPALTSRDIAALDAIPQRPRSAFARIAALVEHSLFGRQELGRADWQACRAAYEDFAPAGAWRS
jgi:hypothetical protein